MKPSRLKFVVFSLSFFLSFVLLSSLFKFLKNFILISHLLAYTICIPTSLILAAIALACFETYLTNVKTSKFIFWFGSNWPQLLFGYVMINIILLSITCNVKWSYSELKDVISVQWTIVGLSITIFLVWRVMAVEFLRKKIPENSDESDLIEKYYSFSKKRTLSTEIASTYTSVFYLTINLPLLIIATSVVYVAKEPNSLFTQNLVICSFYLTTNTIISLFLDILKPVVNEKCSMTNAMKVSQEEFNTVEEELFIQEYTKRVTKRIQESGNYSDDEL